MSINGHLVSGETKINTSYDPRTRKSHVMDHILDPDRFFKLIELSLKLIDLEIDQSLPPG